MQVGADRQTEKSLWISLKCVGSVFTELTEKVDGEKARKLNKERQEWVYLVSHSHMCWPGRRTEREKPFPCVGQFTPNLPPRESAEKRQLLNSSDTPDTPSHSCLSFFFSFFFLSFLKCLTSLWCFSRQEMNGMINVNGDPALFYVRTFIATRLDTLERHTHKYRRKRKPTLTGSRRTVFPLGVVTGWFKGPRWNTFIITILSLEPLFVFN